jgi:multicomponent Na+:H+ antiporter subunit F
MSLEPLVLYLVMPLLGLAFVLSAVRVFRGPSAADRVIALDTAAMAGIGLAATIAILADQAELGDEVLVIALVSFLGTVAYARYVERRP